MGGSQEYYHGLVFDQEFETYGLQWSHSCYGNRTCIFSNVRLPYPLLAKIDWTVISKSQFETHLKKWCFVKNRKPDDWRIVGKKIEKRSRAGKSSEVLMNNKLISATKIQKQTARYKSPPRFGFYNEGMLNSIEALHAAIPHSWFTDLPQRQVLRLPGALLSEPPNPRIRYPDCLNLKIRCQSSPGGIFWVMIFRSSRSNLVYHIKASLSRTVGILAFCLDPLKDTNMLSQGRQFSHILFSLTDPDTECIR